MLFQEGYVLEGLLVLAGLAIRLDEAFKFLQFLKFPFGHGSAMENVPEIGVREHFPFVAPKSVPVLRYHDLSRFVLRVMNDNTLQMGQLLFLLMARILYTHL